MRQAALSQPKGTLERLDPNERMALADIAHDWRLHARPTQLEPEGDWWIWLIRTGRGWGKTRTALETVRARIDRGIWRTVLVAAPTWTDVMDTLVSGSADAPGLLNLWPNHRKPELRRSQDDPHLLCWNGAKVRLRAAQRADRFRGSNNDGAYLDELDSWKPEQMTASEAFALAELTVRTGADPHIIATSTPKRGRLVAELRKRDDVHVTLGHMNENRANLSQRFLDALEARYGGTRLGRQELGGELIEDVEGALVTPATIDQHRTNPNVTPRRVVVGVDPSGSVGGDRQGIIVAGGTGDEGWVLADRSCSMSPEGWGRQAVMTALQWEADCIVVETNYGGDMAKATIEQAARHLGAAVRVRKITASRAKHVRFEPVAALMEQGRLHFPQEPMTELEDEVCAFTPDGYMGDGSPDRADALVWAITELMLERRGLGWGDLYGEAGA